MPRPFDYAITYRALSELRVRQSVRESLDASDQTLLFALIKWGGWPYPIVIDEEDRVVAGEQRLLALSDFMNGEAPTVQLADLTAEDFDRMVAADENLAKRIDAGHDLLARDRAQLARHFGRSPYETPPASAPAPSVPAFHITVSGEHWDIGAHRLFCASAEHSVRSVIEEADAVIIEAPQNVCNERPREEYLKAMRAIAVSARGAVRRGGMIYVVMDWRNVSLWRSMHSVLDVGEVEVCVWTGARGVMGARYEARHKLISCLRLGATAHVNNLDPEAGGQSNVFDAPADDVAANCLPRAVHKRLIEDSVPRGGLVVHLCARTAACLLAAEESGRRAFAVELSPRRCDAIIQRCESEAGLMATQFGRQSFAEVAAERRRRAGLLTG